MKLEVFSVYDRAAMVYSHPIFCVNRAVASRLFLDAFDAPGSSVARHPDDYELRQIGSYDDLEGRFENLPVSETVMTGSEVVLSRPLPKAAATEVAAEEIKVGGTDE